MSINGEIQGKHIYRICTGCGEGQWLRVNGRQPSLLCKRCLWRTPEVREQRRKLSTGRKHTEETKQKIREQRTGKFGDKSNSWKGGRFTEGGYILIKLTPENFFYSMTQKDGYVFEHRLVIAKQIGRCLHPWEVVHHKNHIRDDNRIENLQLVTDERHKQITILENRISYLERLLDQYGVCYNGSLREGGAGVG